MIRAKGGPTVKPSQGNYVGRSLGLIAPSQVILQGGFEDGSNKIGRGKVAQSVVRRWRRGSYLRTMRADRRRGTGRNFGQVPTCYGWRFLSALDALTPDNNPDVEVLSESLSDMLDMSTADSLVNIIETCGRKVDRTPAMCPPPPAPLEDGSHGDNPYSAEYVVVPCLEQCMMDSDCGERQLCCRNSCGGHQCLSTRRQPDNPCQVPDAFMQCLYNQIDSELCE